MFALSTPEAHGLLFDLKWLLSDHHEFWLMGMIEDVMVRLPSLSPEERKYYADYILPPGKRGRARLVLSRPYEARVFAYVAAILRSIE